ncbi:MAG: transglycosylase SLT domain-containing protein [Bdellovibrionaceae bacterium]|nr:transglycosylase SLT domain-containing protein [Pseudobdellovibrionaceae bacterium]
MPVPFRRGVGAIIFFAVLIGCATTSRKDSLLTPASFPPGYDFSLKNQELSLKEIDKIETTAENQSWWKNYRQGLLNLETNSDVSCYKFSELSKEIHFPLREIALLRAHQACTDNKKLEPLNAESYRNNFKFSRDVLARVLLKEARLTSEKTDDIAALLESAQQESIQKNKEQLLLEALGNAQESKDSEKVKTIQSQLYKVAPRLKPDPTDKELPVVALDFRQRREFKKALEIYLRIFNNEKSSREEKFQALKNIRMTHKVAQNKNDYIDSTSQMVNSAKASFKKYKKDMLSIRHLHESYVLLARTLWTEDRLQLAKNTLKEAQRQLKGLHPLDEIYFVLGRMEEEKGQLEKASQYYEASLAEPLSAAPIRERVFWLHPWVLYKMKKYEQAAQVLEDFAQKAKDPSDKNRSLFWQARAYKNIGKSEEALQLFRQLVKEDPIGYYGVLAIREMNQAFTPLKSNEKDFSYSLSNLKELSPQSALQAEWLMAVGEKSFAERIIDQLAEGLKRKTQVDENAWLIVLTSYARANLYLPLFAAFSSLPQEVKDTLVNKHPELLFPRNYQVLIQQAAAAEQIPPEIAFSIIRQESAFNPLARSPVDAFGLMQLLPTIAKNLSHKTNIPYNEPDDLFNPEVNIPLGAKEIKGLLTKYDQQYILAVSAYNASGTAIRGWLKTRYRPDAIEFIEEVPYDETRSYIKLVLRNFVFYKRLNQSETSVPFPEEWLRLVSK